MTSEISDLVARFVGQLMLFIEAETRRKISVAMKVVLNAQYGKFHMGPQPIVKSPIQKKSRKKRAPVLCPVPDRKSVV